MRGTEVELWWTCDNCGDNQIINEGEEFNDLTGEACGFCRNGNYGYCEIYLGDGTKIGEFNKDEPVREEKKKAIKKALGNVISEGLKDSGAVVLDLEYDGEQMCPKCHSKFRATGDVKIACKSKSNEIGDSIFVEVENCSQCSSYELSDKAGCYICVEGVPVDLERVPDGCPMRDKGDSIPVKDDRIEPCPKCKSEETHMTSFTSDFKKETWYCRDCRHVYHIEKEK